jgi:hypothetical protein
MARKEDAKRSRFCFPIVTALTPPFVCAHPPIKKPDSEPALALR